MTWLCVVLCACCRLPAHCSGVTIGCSQVISPTSHVVDFLLLPRYSIRSPARHLTASAQVHHGRNCRDSLSTGWGIRSKGLWVNMDQCVGGVWAIYLFEPLGQLWDHFIERCFQQFQIFLGGAITRADPWMAWPKYSLTLPWADYTKIAAPQTTYVSLSHTLSFRFTSWR